MVKPPSSPATNREWTASILSDRTRLVDRLVVAAYSEILAPASPSGLAVLAVGGYGRRELFPHSDVDLLLLVGEEPDAALKAALSDFLRTLWDQGMRISHSVRTPGECCELQPGNVQLSISLLDRRLSAGDAGLYEKLDTRFPRALRTQRQALTRELSGLARMRHAKYGGSIHHLEPHVKDAPGGIRDFQLVRWLEQLRGTPAAEAEPGLQQAWEFLAAVRCYLHTLAGRDDNRLTFDAQDEIAGLPSFDSAGPAEWMREYFRHARSIFRTALRNLDAAESEGSGLFAQFRDWRSRLSNDEFTVSRERVYLRNPRTLGQGPEAVLRLFEFVARHGLRPASDTERRIADFPVASLPFWNSLRILLTLPHAALALRCMHTTGVLSAMFPEWQGVDCLVLRDFYHRYTVDEHTLVAIDVLTSLPEAQDPLRRRLAELYEELDDPAPLLFALLFHDAGKGAAGPSHVAQSLVLAESAMERIQVPLSERRTVQFLIERHLDLSSIMNTRDLEESSTARLLAQKIETLENLRLLVLLTYADISAVNPSAMTPWRLERLWRLYLITRRELTRELESERIEAPSDGPAGRAAFLEGFPTRYLRTHTESEIEHHVELAQRAAAREVVIELNRTSGFYSLILVTKDRPFLFASVAGTLSGFGMNILKAEAFSNRQGVVLDTFVFSDPDRTLDLNPTELERLQVLVQRAAAGKMDVTKLLRDRARPRLPGRRARIRPSVSFDSETSPSATLIEVVSEDRPGLLYDLARTLSSAGCNIEVVLVNTEAHKALDVFYVTVGGHKLWPEHLAPLRESLGKVIQCGTAVESSRDGFV